jgi:hypothetical protein
MSDTKSSRAGIDLASVEPSPWRAPSRGARPSARQLSASRGRRGTRGAPSAGSRFLGGVLLMVALTASGFGVEGLIQASHERSHVSALQAQVTSLTQRLAADEQGVASERAEVGKVAGRATGVARSVSRSLARISWSLQSVPSEGEMARLRGTLDVYAACVGQLQDELNGLGINWRIDAAKPSTDSFKLFTTARPSGACAAVSGGH